MLKIRINEMINYYAIVVFVFGTGSLYFQQLRMPLMGILEILAIFLLVLRYKRCSKRTIIIFGIITLIFVIDTVITISNGCKITDFVIWTINILFISVLAGIFTFAEFKDYYVKIMVIEAAISLICFMISDAIGMRLPLQVYETKNMSGYYLTPYYTIGWSNVPVFGRNAGMYWEPGGHQIFLNFALLFLLNSETEINVKKKQRLISVIILVVAILSTKSTTGYLCFVLVISTVFMKKFQGKWKYQLLAVVALLIFIIIEINTGVIVSKFEGISTNVGSGKTRLIDTVVGYKLALKNPIWGIGVFNTVSSSILAENGVINISNGMASFALRAGFPTLLFLLGLEIKGVFKKFNCEIFTTLMVFGFILLCINSQGVVLNMIFLVLIAQWRNSSIFIDT